MCYSKKALRMHLSGKERFRDRKVETKQTEKVLKRSMIMMMRKIEKEWRKRELQ